MKVKKNKSIKAKLSRVLIKALRISMISLIVVLGSIAVGFIFFNTNEVQKKDTEIIEQEATIWYAQRIAEITTIRDTIEKYGMTSNPEYDLAGYLASELSKNEQQGIFDYYVGMQDTTCYFGGGWEPAPGEYDPTTRDWYKEAVSRDDYYVSEAYVDAETGRIVITISLPIHENGSTVGVFAADIFTDDIQAIVSGYFDEKDTKYAAMIDSAGNIIAHKNKDFLPYADANGEEHMTAFSEAKIPEQVVNTSELVRKVGSDYKGFFRIYTGRTLTEYGMTVIVVDKGLHFYQGMLIFMFACIAMAIATILFIKKILKKTLSESLEPLNELMVAAENMSKGHLEYTPQYTEEDEIGLLCAEIERSNQIIRRYIEDVADKLEALSAGDLTVKIEEDYIGDFEELKISINKISESLNQTMQTVLNSSDTVHSHAKNVSEETTELSSSVTGVTNQIYETHSLISNIQEKFEKNLSLTKESNQLSTNMTEELQKNYTRLEELLEAMNQISEKSNKIAEIIDVINQIADQTNLLALNASIEAARAGEMGKGFAVVADNVRDLANQTGDAVTNSEELIKESIKAVENGNTLVHLIVDEMKSVVEKTENVNTRIDQITESIKEETAIVKEVSENIKKIDKFTKETEQASHECDAMTQGLYEEADSMREIVGHFQI